MSDMCLAPPLLPCALRSARSVAALRSSKRNSRGDRAQQRLPRCDFGELDLRVMKLLRKQSQCWREGLFAVVRTRCVSVFVCVCVVPVEGNYFISPRVCVCVSGQMTVLSEPSMSAFAEACW